MNGLPVKQAPAACANPEKPGDPDGASADARLLSLDFIGELGEYLASFGAAICAAATAENIPALELALRHARANLIEAIAEFKKISNPEGDAK